MRSAILGLRKRETYEELIDDLNRDQISKYPDRTAIQMENSNYLSQLRGGFEEMAEQNDAVQKERQKQILIQEEAGSVAHSHHEHVINESRWRQHVPPPEEPETFHTPLRVPVGEPQSYAPGTTDVSMSEVRSRSNRKASQRNSPLIQEAQQFNIGTPRSRSPRKAKFKIAHDVDSEAEQAHEMAIDDEEMKAQRDEELREQYVNTSRLMLHAAQNQEIEDIMTGRGDKRRDEGANPKPAQPKARTAGWTQYGTRWTKDEPIPKAPPPKANNSPESEHEPRGRRGRPKSNATPSRKPPPKPKGRPPKAKAPPEEEQESSPRPKSTPASSSTDTPYAKAKAAAEAAAKARPEEPRGKAKPVRKETKQKPTHDTDKVSFDSFEEWNKKGRGFLVDQIQKRPGIKFSKTDAKKMNKKEMIEKLLRFDNKI